MAYVRKKASHGVSSDSALSAVKKFINPLQSKQYTDGVDEVDGDVNDRLPAEHDDSLLLHRYISQIPAGRLTRQSKHRKNEVGIIFITVGSSNNNNSKYFPI